MMADHLKAVLSMQASMYDDIYPYEHSAYTLRNMQAKKHAANHITLHGYILGAVFLFHHVLKYHVNT